MASRAKELSDLGNSGHLNVHDDGTVTLEGGNVGIGTTSPGKLLTLSRATEAQNEQLEFRNVGGISNGNFDGIRWSQGSTGGTMLAEQRIHYYSTGVVDMGFNLRNEDNVLYLKAGGNVGIGTSSPSTVIDARQTSTGGSTQIRVYNTDNSNTTTQTAALFLSPDSRGIGALIFAEKENADFSTSAGRDISLVFSTVLNNTQTERMYITSAGNVGIGATAPAAKLHLDTASSGMPKIRFTHTNAGGDNFEIGTGVDGVSNGGWSIRDIDASANRFVIDSSGNVGIGTGTPTYKLSISQEDNVGPSIELHQASNKKVWINNAGSTGHGSGRANRFEVNGTQVGHIWLGANRVTLGSSVGDGSETLTVLGSNVGIGTTDPLADLHINSGGDNLRITNTRSASQGAQIDLLHFSSSPADEDRQAEINMGGYFSGTNSSYFTSIRSVATDVSAKQGRIDFVTRDDNDFDTVMSIAHNNKVGIGTTSPNQSLEIQGDTPALRIHANNTSVTPNPKIELMRGTSNTFGGDAYSDWRIEVQNNARFYITSNDTTRGENARLIINHDTGNVNIGTDISPGYKLNVQGDLRATGTIYTNTDDIRGEGVNTGLLVGDINGSYANGYGYVELHAQDTKWNQLLHYHGGTGSGSNMWRVGSYYNSSSGDNWYRFYGKGNANKDMLKLNAAEDKIELESPMVRKTTILGSQTAPVNAGPWEHVTSWAISSATATPINFNDVFNNTLFTQYKIHIHHWMSSSDNDQVYIRLLTGTNTAWTLAYHYVALHHHDFSGTHSTTTYSGDNEARIWEGNWYQASGYGGISGEMTIDNVSIATVAGVNIDRGTNAYRPNLRSDMVGYNVGGVGGSPSYRRTIGYTRFNVGNNSSYWKGFQIYNSSNNNAQAGSAISVYGLKAPT